MIDNTTAISYINSIGGRSVLIHNIPLGKVFNRPVCFQVMLSIKTFCFLETRPRGEGYWCLLSWLERSKSLHLSSICSHKQGTSNCSNVDNSSLDSQTSTSFNRSSTCPSQASKELDPSIQSGKSTSSSKDINSSRMQVIRNSHTARGILQKAAKIILHS